MTKLSDKHKNTIIQILESGEDLPLDYKYILFPPEKKEYELVYDGKEREEDILADTMAVPLQPVKTFGTNDKDWTNKLIFGDNLQIMKSLLDDPNIKGQVKLIYIDPPFATKQEFRGTQDQKAYQDKIAGAEFVEFLRKRLIFLRELLADDGSIYIHLDWKKAHYVKVILDVIFHENNFQNQITWYYPNKIPDKRKPIFTNAADIILFYSKYNGKQIFTPQYIPVKAHRRAKEVKINGVKQSVRDENGNVVYQEYDKRLVDSVWNIPSLAGSSKERIDYPTQKPEKLLERIIKASSRDGDIVLDVFAGSGTTLTVAEKLERRWIGIDCGKLAMYTIQKRMLNLRSEIGNKGKRLKPKPFTVYTAGLYDFKQLNKLPWDGWRKFTLLLFNCRGSKHKIAGVELDGYKGNSDVLVFNHLKDADLELDYGFVDDLHSLIGTKVSREFFIIAPAAKVVFLEDYIDKGHTRYYILRIPYSIINELHNRDFEAIKQPIDESQVNDTVDAVGFDFIRPPKVVCEYCRKKPKDELYEVAAIKIKTFKSEAMLKGASQLGNRESLSMVMVDFDYKNKGTFNLDKVFYASDIEKNKWEVHLSVESFKDKIMVIYLDFYGNEYREIKTLNDFKRRKK
ncbi:MAG: site-specific DNA-methyltransferase [Desulfobacteraceae bacterium]|nr:site-specific DNA-methyltransferase [Desulfobacteraceae bacterium]